MRRAAGGAGGAGGAGVDLEVAVTTTTRFVAVIILDGDDVGGENVTEGVAPVGCCFSITRLPRRGFC